MSNENRARDNEKFLTRKAGPVRAAQGAGFGEVRLPVVLLLLVVALLAATSSLALAQVPKDPVAGPLTPPETPSAPDDSLDEPAEVSPAGRGPIDEREVEAFFDGYFAQQLEGYDIPGATVSVVKDGEIFFAKGYGFSDVEANEPVAADETLFRIASVSKLFTATAVMQLMEEGRLDLDDDVNTYLDDVEIPDTYPGRPVTLRHLLTHTAGFEQRFVGSGVRSAADVEPLGESLAEEMPARVRPPGELAAYSNYGIALAGYIVQEVSGVPFERYVEENVLTPLGMENTTAAQPPAPELKESLAVGYDLEGGDPVAKPFEYIDGAPAGVVSTTATDAARFMIAHLQNGRYGDARILKEATAKDMHERHFAHDPRLDGIAYGFYEQTLNGERTIQHSGNLSQFHALLALLPEHEVGLFVAYNSYGDGGRLAEYELFEAFLDRYYPEPAPRELRTPGGEEALQRAERFAGSYRTIRASQTGLEKIATLLTGVSVTPNGDGSITTTGLLTWDQDPEQRWIEVEPLLFRADDHNQYIAFREDEGGRITHLFSGADPTIAYVKLPAYLAPRLHLGLLVGSVAVFLLTALLWPIGALIARRYKGSGSEPGWTIKSARRARLLAWGVCALNLLFVVGMLPVYANPVEMLGYGASPLLIAVLALPVLSAVGTIGVLACAGLAWKHRYWGVFGRLHYSLVALSALTFVVLLNHYNLLGFRL